VIAEEDLDIQHVARAAKLEEPKLEKESAARAKIVKELREATDQYTDFKSSHEAFDVAIRRAQKEYDAVPVTAVE